MANATTHYRFVQPLSTDYYDLAVWNNNMEMIDNQIYQTQTTPYSQPTASEAAKPGVVPAPTANDTDKVPHGDGTWDTALSRIDFTQLSVQQVADLKTMLGI